MQMYKNKTNMPEIAIAFVKVNYVHDGNANGITFNYANISSLSIICSRYVQRSAQGWFKICARECERV